MDDKKFSYDSINFHKTFATQDSYISKILGLAEQGYSGTKEEISEITGIPTGKTSGKVVPHILDKFENFKDYAENYKWHKLRKNAK